MINFDKFIVDEMDATKEEIAPLYRIYVTEMEDMLLQLGEATENSDSEAYKRLLHNVKGINANMRLDELTLPVTEMYKVLLDGNQIDLDKSTKQLREIFTHIETEINTYFDGL